jgi:hypothetical protein
MKDNNQNYYHNSIFNLYLKESQIPESGLGIYTKDIISANTMIDEYLGDIIEKYGGPYALCVKDNYYIDAFNLPRCYMAMLNDASHITKKIIKKKKRKTVIIPNGYYDKNNKLLENNCEFIFEGNRAYIYSTREILPDEELFISYGDNYWNK